MPSELVADLCDEDDELHLSVTPSTLLHHMEELCDIVKPSEIREIMNTFNQPFNDALTMAQCFKRQQKCKDHLKSTAVPLTENQMIWTCLQHFEQVVFLTGACRHWKRKEKKDKTWSNFKKHCKQHHTECPDEQATCHSASMANSATTTAAELEDAQATVASKDDHPAAVLAQNVALKAMIEEHQSKCTPVPPPVETSTISNSASDLTGDVTVIKQQLAQLQAAMAAQAQLRPALAPIQEPTRRSTGKPCIRPPQGNRSTRFFDNMNCCWTHGFDIGPSHTGATCRTPKEGHKTDATVTNQMGGSQTNCHLIPN